MLGEEDFATESLERPPAWEVSVVSAPPVALSRLAATGLKRDDTAVKLRALAYVERQLRRSSSVSEVESLLFVAKKLESQLERRVYYAPLLVWRVNADLRLFLLLPELQIVDRLHVEFETGSPEELRGADGRPLLIKPPARENEPQFFGDLTSCVASMRSGFKRRQRAETQAARIISLEQQARTRGSGAYAAVRPARDQWKLRRFQIGKSPALVPGGDWWCYGHHSAAPPPKLPKSLCAALRLSVGAFVSASPPQLLRTDLFRLTRVKCVAVAS